jgi:hypothetical protein
MSFFHWIQSFDRHTKQLITPKFHDQHKVLYYEYKKATSLEEAKLWYVTIWFWWYSLGTTNEGAIHDLNNRVVKTDVTWPFCVECHVNVHLHMFIASIKTKARFFFFSLRQPSLLMATENGFQSPILWWPKLFFSP